ncbi:MAG: patatin-like phospholipase family protein [Cyclobacteriaceae bacterium]
MGQKVALVLSSGGARGMAHIGVIESLLRNGYEISSISGSSIGSVVGAFYAAGKLGQCREWLLTLDRIDVFKLIDFTFSVQGFVKGEKVFKSLEEIMPDQKIEDLRIPFCALATDIQAKKEVAFHSGSVYEALKASVAIPTVIKPLRINDKDYIDGGVTNPIPIDHVKRSKGDILVVSNANAIVPYVKEVKDLKKDKIENESYNQKIQQFLQSWTSLLPESNHDSKSKLGFFDILNESIDLMQDKLTSLILEKHKPDILVDISRDICSTFEFYKANEVIASGDAAFEKAHHTFLKEKSSR